MHDLLDHVFNTGLSPQLIEALTQLVTHIPSLLQLIEERLIHELSIILTKTTGARCRAGARARLVFVLSGRHARAAVRARM